MNSSYTDLQKEVEALRRRVAELEAAQDNVWPFAEMLDAMPFPVLIKDAELRWRYVNKALCGMVGQTRNELLGLTVYDVQPEEESRETSVRDRKVLESGIPLEYERTTSYNGKPYHVTTLKVPWDNPATGERYIISIVRDLTAVHMTQKALLESQEKFTAVVRNSPLAIHMYELDPEGSLVFVDANPAAEALTGKKSAPFVGQRMEDIFPGLAKTELPDRYKGVIQTGEPWLARKFPYDDGLIAGMFDIYAFQVSASRMVVQFRDITEQLRTQERMEAGERRYESLFENSPIPLWEEDFSAVKHFLDDLKERGITDVRRHFQENPEDLKRCAESIKLLHINEACMHMLGAKSKEEVLVGNISAYFNEDSYVHFLEEFVLLAEGETNGPLHGGVHQTADGEIKRIIGSLNVMPGYEDTLERVLVSTMDVTERHRVEQALQKSEERLRLVLQATKDGIWEWEIRSGKCKFSDTYHTMLGYEPGDLEPTYQQWRDLLHPDDRVELDKKNHWDIRTGTEFRLEFRLRARDGHWHWIMSRGQVVEFDSSGHPVRMIGAHTDISELKRIQEELVEYRNLVESMSDNMLDMLWAKDLGGTLLFSNRVFNENLLCHDGIDPIGRTHSFFADRMRQKGEEYTFDQECQGSDDIVLSERTPGRFIEDGVVKGEYIVLDVRKSPLYDSAGTLIGTMGMGRDITEQKKADEALVKAKDAAEAAARSKDQFLANMSHEIRTPMNGVLGMLQLLRASRLDSEQAEYVDTCLESGRGLLSVINDILDFSKMDAGTFELMHREFVLHETIRTVLHSFSVQARDKRIGLGYEIDPRLPKELLGDDARLRQVLFNVVGNAVKFTHSGSVRVQADMLRNTEAGILVGMEISDTGIGIQEDMLGMVFEPFTQADGSYTREYQGTGLGLGIVRKLIQRMGGSICIDSAEKEGTTIYFTFMAGTQETGAWEADRPSAGGKNACLRVLVAEDDEVNRFTIKRYLEKLGHEVVTARNGREAVDLLQTEETDCVLMDIQMPIMDGMEATVAIREREQITRRRRVPIVALTAHAMKGDREKFLEAGMDGYLAKPLELDELVTVIQEVTSG